MCELVDGLLALRAHVLNALRQRTVHTQAHPPPTLTDFEQRLGLRSSGKGRSSFVEDSLDDEREDKSRCSSMVYTAVVAMCWAD